MSSLPQLRQSLMLAAEGRAAQAREPERGGEPRRARRRPRYARRSSLAVMLVFGLLMLAAVAYATTQLIKTGSPVQSEEHFAPNAGAGVAIARSEGLLGIAAADPDGGPPWTMRIYDTSRGLGCAQVGRLLRGRIGVLGQDGAFNDDGRFHPLPAQASQAEGECVLLDGRGHAFLGVANYGVAASGLRRACYLLHASRAAKERCAKADPRDIYYGLLGPDARSITYTLAGQTHTIPTVGPDGAYLIVEATPAAITAMGVGGGGAGALPAGGGSLSDRTQTIALPQPIKLVTYSGGRTCRIGRAHDWGSSGGHCVPPVGFVAQHVTLPSARAVASPIDVQTVPGAGAREAQLTISFTARAAVTSALSGYSASLIPARSGRCSAGNIGGAAQQLGRNVRAGERVQLTLSSHFGDSHGLFPTCPGVAHGTVFFSIPSSEFSSAASYGPFLRRHAGIVVVGRFTYDAPR